MATDSGSALFRQRVAAACALVSSALAVLVLASWIVGRWQLLTFGTEFIPMAPSTAVLLLMTSAVLAVEATAGARASAHRAAQVLALLVLVTAVLIGGPALLGASVSFENQWWPTSESVRGVPVGRMSPLTALGLMLTAGALLSPERDLSGRFAGRIVRLVLATSALALAGVVLTGYAAGAPALYGTRAVPMSLVAALALAPLASGALLLSLRGPLPAESMEAARLRKLAGGAFTLLVIVVSIAAVVFLRTQLADARAGILADLETITDQKAVQIANWRLERLSDAAFVARAPFVAADVRAVLATARGRGVQAGRLDWIRLLGNGRQYDRMFLFDADATPQAVLPNDGERPSAPLRRFVADGLRRGSVEMTTLYADVHGDTHLALIIPVMVHPAGTRMAPGRSATAPLAVIALEVDASRHLFPLVESWPTPSRTAENLLVERDGEEVVFLNRPRHWPDSAPTRRRSLHEENLPAAWAVRDEQRSGDGVDYRGVAVVAVSRAVRGSTWRLVGKIDQLEVYAPLRRRAAWTGVWLVLFAVFGGMGLAGLWQTRELVARREADEALRESAQRFRDVFESANVGKSITSPDGHLQVNRAFAAMLGYSREELGRATWQELTPAEDIAPTEAILAPLRSGSRDEARFTKRYLHKSGAIVWGDVSTNVHRAADGTVQYFITTVTDITEHIAAMMALKQSEERFTSAFNAGPAGMIITRIADGQIIEANEAFCQMFEYERETVIGSNSVALGMLTPEGRQALIQYQIETGGVRNFDLTTRTRTGRRLDVSLSSQPIEIQGTPHHVTTIIDVTARRQAEQAVRDGERLFSTAFETSPVGMAITDQAGVFLRVNIAWERLLGYARADVIGRRAVDLGIVTPAARERALERAAARPDKYDHDMRLRCRDGSPRDVLYSHTVISLGGVPHRLSVLMDVTERKRAEVALRESEMRFASAFRAGPIGISIAQASTGRIVDVNAAFLRMFEYEQGEIIGHTSLELRLVSEAQRNIMIQHRATTGGTSPLEVEARTKSGRQLAVLIASQGIEIGGEAHIVTTAIDVTARREAEQEIRALNAELEERIATRTAELVATNKELEAFAYSVSHDLRAPLRAVDGYVNILLEQYSAQLDDEGRRICAVIREGAQNLGRLIDDLLAYSRTGRAELHRTQLDMQGTARAVFLDITTPEQRQRVDLRIGDLPPAYGDPTLIGKVWTNLLDNALKFSGKRERSVIEVGCLAADRIPATEGMATLPATSIVYFVRDNGAGFDMSYAGRLFGMFQRLHSVREFPGTGVGLAIVHRIIERHGGRVWAEGRPGEGATVYFTLKEGV